MNSPAPVLLATAWYFWRRHRLFALAFLSYFGALVVLGNTAFRGRGFQAFAGYSIPLMFSILYFLAIFAHAHADIISPTSGFPAHLLLLPVSTGRLVFWPMLLGAVTLAVGWVMTVRLIVVPVGAQMPLWWPAAMLGAILAWLQAIVWSPMGLPFARVLLCIVVLGSIIAFGFIGSAFGLSAGLLLLVHLVLIALAYSCAFVGVLRARSGAAPDWQAPIERFLSGLGSGFEPKPFSSAAQAQFWYEWRSGGLIVPLMVAGAAIAFALPGFWIHYWAPLGIGDIEVNVWTRCQGMIMLVPPFLVVVTGGRSGSRNRKGLDLLMATRPITSTAFVLPKLRAAALSAALAWGVVLAAMAAWLLAPARSGGRTGRLGYLLYERANAGNIVLLTVVLLLAIFWTWKMRAQWLWIQLTGRRWITDAFAVVVPCVMLTAACFLGIFWATPEFKSTLTTVPYRLLVLGVLLKPVCACFVLRALYRRGIMNGQGLEMALVGWFIVTSVVFFVLYVALPGSLVEPLTVGLLSIHLVPLSRLAAGPLAFEWNRHR